MQKYKMMCKPSCSHSCSNFAIKGETSTTTHKRCWQAWPRFWLLLSLTPPSRRRRAAGKLHFVKFETARIDECIDFIEAKGLHRVSSLDGGGGDAPDGADAPDSKVRFVATGGGAYKYADKFQVRQSLRHPTLTQDFGARPRGLFVQERLGMLLAGRRARARAGACPHSAPGRPARQL